jgi:exodeoxyribonuclease X
MKILFLDTETTDAEPDARLVQLAYKNDDNGDIVNEYFKPPVDIALGAMAVHHITSKMVEDKPAFIGSETEAKLKQDLEDHLVVAHNAPFDVNILKNEGIEISEYIDTLRIARHILDSEGYGMQFLRYSLDLGIEGMAHDAMGDVIVLESLFEYLKTKLVDEHSLKTDEDIIEKMKELTRMPVLMDVFLFGKHRGKSFKEVALEDRGYIEWLHGSETIKPESEQNEDLVYTLKHYLG